MNDEPNCWTCAYSNLPETAEPCASCDMYFSHFESSESTESTEPPATVDTSDSKRCRDCKHFHDEGADCPCGDCVLRSDGYLPNFEPAEPTDTAASTTHEDERRCKQCLYRDVPIVQSPCQKCALTPGLPSYTVDTNKLVEMEMMKREEAKRREAKMAGPTCLTCKHKGVSIEEEPCISCNGYQNYTPDESAPCAEGTDENDDVIEPCNSCTHRDNLRCNPPCSHCRRERGIEYPEYEEAEDIVKPACATCKYGDLPGTVEPCASCFDEGLDHPLNYEGSTDSGDEGSTDSGFKGIVPKHIVDMFVERMKQAVLRSVNERNTYPRPCPYCGEIPEVVGETIYPGEEHCYVVCNGAKLLPHSISIHGRTREEAVARWNSFALTMKSQEK